MNYSFDRTERAGVLTFRGSLTEAQTSEIREVLMVSWEKTGSIIIDLKQVTEIDEPCLRIFCKAYRMALMTNKLFAIAAISSETWERISRNQTLCYPECDNEFPADGSPFACIRNCLWGIKGESLR